MQATLAGNPAVSQRPPESLLDVRGIQPPDNVLTVLKRVSELSAGTGLEIRADSNPWQLYDLLQQRGFFLEMRKEKDGSYFGAIRQRELDKLKG